MVKSSANINNKTKYIDLYNKNDMTKKKVLSEI